MLIRHGTIVTPTGMWFGDLRVAGETITAIGIGLEPQDGEEVLDASGCIVLPGLVDPHLHIQLDTGLYRTADDWFIGTRSAACGGVTTVIDFATQFPGQTLRQAVENRHAEIAGRACIDYGLHCMVTDLPAGREATLADLVELGCPSAKVYTTYRPHYYQDDDQLLRLFQAAADAGILVMVHAENDALVAAATQRLVAEGKTGWAYHGQARPPLAEAEAVQRVLFLAREAGCYLYVVHCTTALAVEMIRAAQAVGQHVVAETCPQYLLLDEECYAGPHPEWYILQPPLRAPQERERLWQLLRTGAIATLGTDHCDYTLAQKTASPRFTETPGGLPGLETALPLMATYGVKEGRLTWPQLVNLMSTNPARLFGLYPRKGVLQPGSDADLVIYDPTGESVITASSLRGVSGYTPYEGMAVAGRVRTTISRGRVVYNRGEFLGEAGWGRFVKGQRFFAERDARSGGI